jgi:2-amino-4-hydroxy-6-hydroxymethyldihydropteridine diphosphokinase
VADRHRAWIGLGANLGHRRETLAEAVVALAGIGQLAAVSGLYRSAPVGGPPQPWYANAVVALDTVLEPPELLAALQAVERRFGRVRTVRWGARTLDLDILAYDDVTWTTPTLRLPHPEASRRRFVLEPWVDIWPDGVLAGRPLRSWLDAVRDQVVERVADGDWWARPGTAVPADGWAPPLITTLARAGHRIVHDQDTWRIVDGPGGVGPEAIRRHVVAGSGREWLWVSLGSTDSTMDAARQAWSCWRRPLVVVAEIQRRGRGRRGRRWWADPGAGLTMSFAFSVPTAALARPFALWAGAAAAVAVERVTGVRVELKWPNDGLIARRKCLGILVETAVGPHEALVVVGIGVNVNGRAPDAVPDATTLERETGRPWPRAALATAIADSWRTMVTAGDDPVQQARWLDEWRRRDATYGHLVRVVPAAGAPWAGRACGVLADGALVVETAAGRRLVRADEVSLRVVEEGATGGLD